MDEDMDENIGDHSSQSQPVDQLEPQGKHLNENMHFPTEL